MTVAITAEMVKNLRVASGAGVMECRKALEETGGDFDKACGLLLHRALATAAKKETREAKEGLVGYYVHAGAKVGALIEVNCESDFVARTDEFQALVHDLAMQVVAANPLYLKPENVPADVIEVERKNAMLEASGKPAQVAERIVEGKLTKYYEENCLMKQPFIKDGNLSVGDLVTQAVAKMGENIVVRRFVRYALGE
jgi:elongation factor Ts